ncbi:DUF2512 family protein [Aneurinibacillus migulanus]|uniref:DUF2512 family protein n=1 Tax=Aneurinibacillus migulanus TaxID=47500 RepID=A0A0K2WDU3_ANEMI|nr:DUF2512 family protein [Aneurinibacillus migulanus]MCP1356659.1 YndM family protein [Aneurinibacillus migulanus]MED0894984.1 DUF2512 family protein [Aneurinibacillus migulanus]MED1614774.1 DUF2512 family protein [Aneurinibacillus migulanus]MED4727269.1 DUF2512 family protein [Aneurinibacillus migulanus]CEH29369.1 Uncharacterized protein BN1090_A2_01796 [Aneurinibacillus migulanus]
MAKAHIKAFGIKLARFSANIFLFLGLVFNVPFSYILAAIIILSVVSYVIGDLVILRFAGNGIATALDVVLFVAGIWAVAYFIDFKYDMSHMFALLVVIGYLVFEESLYHVYIEKEILGTRKESLLAAIDKY